MFEPASFLESAQSVAVLLCFRAVPVLGFVLSTKRISRSYRLAIGVAAAGVVASTAGSPLLGWPWVFAAYAYFGSVAMVVPRAARWMRSGRLTAGGAFAASASLFFVLPALVLPFSGKEVALVLGWDLMLSVYSYCVETSKTSNDPPLRACLFFLLVNPALVYTQRGRQVGEPAIHWRGLARCGAGMLSLFAASAFLLPMHTALKQSTLPSSNGPRQLATLLGVGALRFLIEYWRQSGLANVQIGMLRQLGYELPERFVLPILARDLADFWRRWNTYVGQWLLRYVFVPCSLHVGREWGLGTAAKGLGIVVTFLATGLLHDVNAYAYRPVIEVQSSALFALNGMAILLWLAGRSVLQWVRRRTGSPGVSGAGASLPSRALLWMVVLGCFSRL